MATPQVFISSALGRPGSRLRGLRDDLRIWADREGVDVFLFEAFRTRTEWDALPPAQVEQICLEHVRQSSLFICVIDDAYGGSHGVHLADVSFTDLEFFQAFQCQIPQRIYIHDTNVAQPELRALVTIVQTLVPNAITYSSSIETIRESIKRDILAHVGRRQRAMLSAESPDAFVRALIATRQRHDDSQEGMRFLLDQYPIAEPSRFDAGAVEHQIDDASSLPAMGERLDAIWTVFERLFAVPWRTNEEWLPLWDRALSAWDKASAWYGLHGFLLTGKLSANNTLLAVRALRASSGESDSLPELIARNADKTGNPAGWIHLFEAGGSLASEYFSIGRQAPQSLRRKYFLKARDWCTVADRAEVHAPDLTRESSVASMRAQILWELGQRDDALKEMKRSLERRIDAGVDSAGIGWAQVLLGHSTFLVGQRRAGWELVDQGMPAVEAGGSPGFIVRALKRRMAMHASSQNFVAALRDWERARAISRKHQLQGQMRALSASALIRTLLNR